MTCTLRLFTAPQMVAAVADMHRVSLLHRDIKAENFVLAQDAEEAAAAGVALQVKLIDLGMAMKYDPKSPVIGAATLTQGIMLRP